MVAKATEDEAVLWHRRLGHEEGEDVDVHLYRSMIGCLMYLTASRPVTPKVSHLHAVKRIF
ncbi:hypothetical protein Tco_0473515, partial [Tanacetum coccineum]